jgi:hypothetical protein
VERCREETRNRDGHWHGWLVRRGAIEWREHLLHDKWRRTSTWSGAYQQNRERPMLQDLLCDTPDDKIAEATRAMGAEDDQVRMEFNGMRRDATRHIGFWLQVNMALHGKAPCPQPRADLVEIARGLNASGQMPLPVHGCWRSSLEYMEKYHLSIAATGKLLHSW